MLAREDVDLAHDLSDISVTSSVTSLATPPLLPSSPPLEFPSTDVQSALEKLIAPTASPSHNPPTPGLEAFLNTLPSSAFLDAKSKRAGIYLARPKPRSTPARINQDTPSLSQNIIQEESHIVQQETMDVVMENVSVISEEPASLLAHSAPISRTLSSNTIHRRSWSLKRKSLMQDASERRRSSAHRPRSSHRPTYTVSIPQPDHVPAPDIMSAPLRTSPQIPLFSLVSPIAPASILIVNHSKDGDDTDGPLSEKQRKRISVQRNVQIKIPSTDPTKKRPRGLSRSLTYAGADKRVQGQPTAAALDANGAGRIPLKRADSLQDWDRAKRNLRARRKAANAGKSSEDLRYISGSEDETDALKKTYRIKGNPIEEGHPNYMLMYNMLTGIRASVSRILASDLNNDLVVSDFRVAFKVTQDIIGNELTTKAEYDFKFKDYAPRVFQSIRMAFGVTGDQYLKSLCSRYILSELGSPGKSGSFFYFSQDYRFIIKTIHASEHKFLRKILKFYYDHVVANPNTLISRFYGLHRIRMKNGPKIHFVVMSNIFPAHRDIHEAYDLKGSLVGRHLSDEERRANPHTVMKDQNWLQRDRHFEFGPEKRTEFQRQLEVDTDLLARLDIMDYSLLVGIHDLKRGNREMIRQSTLTVFEPRKAALAAAAAGLINTDKNANRLRRQATAVRQAIAISEPVEIDDSLAPAKKHDAEREMFVFFNFIISNRRCSGRFGEFERDDGGYLGTNEQNEALNLLYYIGIIDILTPYTVGKRIEHYWKSIAYNSRLISAVNPQLYARRFLNFILESIRTDNAQVQEKRRVNKPNRRSSQKANGEFRRKLKHAIS